MKKVLIVIFTDGRLYNSVYKAACEQDYSKTSVLISVRKANPKLSSHQNQVIHHNYVRKLCKASDADYFFFIDSDILIPQNAVSNLMKQFEQQPLDIKCFGYLQKQFKNIETKRKHIIGGWVKLKLATKTTPTLWNASRWIADNTITSLMSVEPSIARVDKIGSGCMMMSREVMEKISWRLDPNLEINLTKNGHNHPCRCVTFAIDAQDAGYELWMDGSVIAKHLSIEKNIIERGVLCLKTLWQKTRTALLLLKRPKKLPQPTKS